MIKRVLYITYDGLTDPLGQSQILPYLSGLSQQGYQFTILSFEKKAKLEKEGPLVSKLVADANIDWVPLSFTASPPLLSKIYDRSRMWRTALRLHRQKKFQLAHCRSYVSAEVGLRLKRRFGIRFLFDMRGFWADEKVDNGQWQLSNPLYRTIYRHYKQKEKTFLLNADGIVSLTEAAKEYLLQLSVYQKLDITVIPCCADLAHFDYRRISTQQKDQQRQALHLPKDAKVISYVGSFGGWYMAKEMFEFVQLLQRTHPEYYFLFLTKDDPEKVKEEAGRAGLSMEKLIVRYGARHELPLLISLSQCSLFFIRNTFSKIASSPTKHAELMGMGVPVVCNDIGDTGKIVRQTQTGILVEGFDTKALSDAVNRLPLVEAIPGEHIRQSATAHFDLKVGIERYALLYQKVFHALPAPAQKTDGHTS